MRKKLISITLILCITFGILCSTGVYATGNDGIFAQYIPQSAAPEIQVLDSGIDSEKNVYYQDILYLSRENVPYNNDSGDVLDKQWVFAKVAYPVGEGTYPGILNLHGGGGDAHNDDTVRNYASKGYVVIQPEIPGIANPDNATISPDSTGVWKSEVYSSRHLLKQSEDVTQSVLYDAIIACLQAFHILQNNAAYLAQAEKPDGVSANIAVDAQNLGITGVSWGGYLTTMLSGLLGNQVKAAMPVFGTGYYDEGSKWGTQLNGLPADVKTAWLDNYDAGRKANNITADFYMCMAANDNFFYPSAVMATYNAIPDTTKKYIWFSPNSNHALNVPYTDTSGSESVYRLDGRDFLQTAFFANSLKSDAATYGGAMPKITIGQTSEESNGDITIDFTVENFDGTSYGTSGVPSDIDVYYSYSKEGDWPNRNWHRLKPDSFDTDAKTGSVTFNSTVLGQGKLDYFILAYDYGGYKVGGSTIQKIGNGSIGVENVSENTVTSDMIYSGSLTLQGTYDSAIIEIDGITYMFVPMDDKFNVMTVSDDGTVSNISDIVSNGTPYEYTAHKNVPDNARYGFVKARAEGDRKYLYFITFDSTLTTYGAEIIRKVDITDPYTPQIIVDYSFADCYNSTRSSISNFDFCGDKLYVFGHSKVNWGYGSVLVYDASITDRTTVAQSYIGSIKIDSYTWSSSTYGRNINGCVRDNKIYAINPVNLTNDYFLTVICLNDDGKTVKSMQSVKVLTTENTTSNKLYISDVKVIDNYAYITCLGSDGATNSQRTKSSTNQAESKIIVVDLTDQENDGFSNAKVSGFVPEITDTLNSVFDPFALAVDGSLLYVIDMGSRVICYDTGENPMQPQQLFVNNFSGYKVIKGKVVNGDLYVTNMTRLYKIKAEIAYLKNGNTVKVSFRGFNDSDNDVTVKAIYALYKDNDLINVGVDDLILTKNTNNMPFTVSADISPKNGDDSVSGYTLEIFIWDEFDTLQPVLGTAYRKDY